MTEANKPAMGHFTPLFDDIMQEHGIITAAVYGYIWRKCQLERGVCDASFQTVADDLNMSRRTIVTHIKLLVEVEKIVDLTPENDRKPHKYLVQEMQQIRAIDALDENQTRATDSTTREINAPLRAADSLALGQEMQQTRATNAPKDTDTKRNKLRDREDTPPQTPRPGYADLIWNGVKEFFSNDETQARNVMQAQAAFSDITGIKQPYVNGNSGTYREAERNWWEPLGRMMTDCDNDLGTFRDCIMQVMVIADAPDGFTVASPRSAVKTFGGVLAKRSRVVDIVVTVAGDETPAQRIARLFPNEVNNEMA